MKENSRDPFETAQQKAVRLTLENWDSLGVVDNGPNGLLLPVKIRTRNIQGTLDERDAMLMCVGRNRSVEARKRSRVWFNSLKLDYEHDKDYLAEFEKFEILAYAIRDPHEPHDQMYPDGKELWAAFGNVISPLIDLYGQLDEWEKMNDPRYGELSPEETWETIALIARDGNLLPLMRRGSLGQIACIIVSARAAMRSEMCPLRLRWPSLLQSANESSEPTAKEP